MTVLFTNSLILMARYVRQMQSPPSDADVEKLVQEKLGLETQANQDQRTISGLKATMEQLENDLKKSQEVLTMTTNELEALKTIAKPTT